MATNKIKDLVFSFMNMVGIECKEVAADVWAAHIPEKEQLFFNGFEDLKFTFSRELAEQHRDIELICDGSFLLRKIIERLGEIPKASRLFSNRDPEVPPALKNGLRVVDSGNVYYRQKVVFNFKVLFECDQRREKLFSIVTDPVGSNVEINQGLMEIDTSEFSEQPQDGIKIEESGPDILRLYLESCQKLEQEIQEDISELKDWGTAQCSDELKKFEAYLDEQKQELLKKKENVCFHLYFFQKEEEIDKLIGNLEEEHNRKLRELKEKFSLRVNISLINAVVLCVPTVATSPGKVRKNSAASVAKTVKSSLPGVEARSANY
ncbi:MAG: hypothetical protein PWR01_3758 [Clostridiales bacterium]|jgi:hypothetical protein|nr:hypothetical protein [Clostridiales bacterium]MDN5282685.1 hypothetical protein [Candidatus Ozemobacter sp.]